VLQLVHGAHTLQLVTWIRIRAEISYVNRQIETQQRQKARLLYGRQGLERSLDLGQEHDYAPNKMSDCFRGPGGLVFPESHQYSKGADEYDPLPIASSNTRGGRIPK
jgi:hypothetical protein